MRIKKQIQTKHRDDAERKREILGTVCATSVAMQAIDHIYYEYLEITIIL